jgi:hypothetical protein
VRELDISGLRAVLVFARNGSDVHVYKIARNLRKSSSHAQNVCLRVFRVRAPNPTPNCTFLTKSALSLSKPGVRRKMRFALLRLTLYESRAVNYNLLSFMPTPVKVAFAIAGAAASEMAG